MRSSRGPRPPRSNRRTKLINNRLPPASRSDSSATRVSRENVRFRLANHTSVTNLQPTLHKGGRTIAERSLPIRIEQDVEEERLAYVLRQVKDLLDRFGSPQCTQPMAVIGKQSTLKLLVFFCRACKHRGRRRAGTLKQ